MANGRELLQAELASNELILQYSGSGTLADFISIRQRRRYHDSWYNSLASLPVEIKVFSLPDFDVFSMEVLGASFYGESLVEILNLARPNKKERRVSPTNISGIIADWEIPDYPQREQRLLTLHQRLKEKWEDFIWGDRYQFMGSLVHQADGFKDVNEIIKKSPNPEIEPEMRPHMLWSTSKMMAKDII